MRPRIQLAALVSAVAIIQYGVTKPAAAQSVASYASGTYSQNFDTLPATSPSGTSGTAATAGVGFSNVTTTYLTDPGLYATGVTPSGALSGWFFSRQASGSGANNLFRWDNGGSNSGSAFSYGATGSTDRALGSLASGTTVPLLGVVLQNTSSTTYTDFTLGFAAEQWRSSTSVQNKLTFGYAVTNDPNSYTTTAASPYDALGQGSVSTNGATDGNAVRNVVAPHSLASSSFSWAPGQYLVLTWADVNDAGNDAGIGLDDLTFSAGQVAYIAQNKTWTGAVNNNWDTATSNFTTGSTAAAYTEVAGTGDNVTFTATGAGTVSIQAGGVTPTSVSVLGGNYTFGGGPIQGATGIYKSGGGTLTLTGNNTFAGGINIDGGKLVYSSDSQLGSGALTSTGSDVTVQATGSTVGTRTLGISGIGNGMAFDTNGNNVTFGGLQAGSVGTPVNFVKIGAGTLTFTGSTFVAFGSDLQVLNGALALDSKGATDGIAGSRGDGNWTGNLIVLQNQYLNFGAPTLGTTYISGGGQIIFKGAGYGTGSPTGATNVSALGSQSYNVVVGNQVVVNPDNVGPYRILIGGDFFDSTLTFNAAITGNTDVQFSYDGAGLGGGNLSNGLVTLNVPATYTGKTLILGGVNSSVRAGVDNALPVGTALSFGESNNYAGGTNAYTIGALDLNGHTVTVASLASFVPAAVGTNAPRGVSIDGIANGSGDAGTLVINGSATTTYAGSIGAAIVSSNVATPSSNINLTLASTNTGKLTLTAANGTVAYTGKTTISGGTLAYTYAIDQTVQSGPIVVNGTGRLELDQPGSASSHVVVAVPVATVAATGTVAIGAVNLSAVQAEVVVAGTLSSVAGAGKLDLGNNDAVFHSQPAATLAYGTNVLSSVAGTGAGRDSIATLGIVDNVDGQGGALYASFDGVAVTSGDTLVKYTYVGDTNLDGVVDAQDLANLLAGEASGGALKGWLNGDLNYSGTIDSTDYNLLLNSLQNQGASFGNSVSGGSGAVPEPTSAALLVPAAGLLARRRRR